MIITMEMDLNNFEFWCGAKETFRIIEENDKVDECQQLLEELYPNGMSDTQLNDLFWFEDEWLFETLGIEIEY